jgi:hypothetical protein
MDRVIRGGVALLLVAALLALSGVAVGGSNERPLADAGLDQRVAAGEAVRLDATGSRDPDGNVTGYEWAIETPSGGTITPDCRTCGTTSFSPDTPGRYNVTVTVTDDDGATAADTLYVEVDAAPGPSVSLSGPTDPTVERSGGDPSGEATYVANVSRGGHPIDSVEWQVDGEQTVQRSVDDGGVDSISYVHNMESAADHTLTVRVVDTAGRNATESMTISPQVQSGGGGYDGGDSGTDPYMQADWAGRTITFRAPTIDTETGEVVRQSEPTMEELNTVATADPGEEVKTDFTDDENDGTDNQRDTNDDSEEGYENDNKDDGGISTVPEIPFGGGSSTNGFGNSGSVDDLCIIC